LFSAPLLRSPQVLLAARRIVGSRAKKDGISVMIAGITNYLRSRAHTCILLARACPDMATSRGLEELAIDLMARAKEIEELYSQ
jgi:hypothetical protein